MSLCNSSSTQVSGNLPSPSFTVSETNEEDESLSSSDTDSYKEENSKNKKFAGKNQQSLKHRVKHLEIKLVHGQAAITIATGQGYVVDIFGKPHSRLKLYKIIALVKRHIFS